MYRPQTIAEPRRGVGQGASGDAQPACRLAEESSQFTTGRMSTPGDCLLSVTRTHTWYPDFSLDIVNPLGLHYIHLATGLIRIRKRLYRSVTLMPEIV